VKEEKTNQFVVNIANAAVLVEGKRDVRMLQKMLHVV